MELTSTAPLVVIAVGSDLIAVGVASRLVDTRLPSRRPFTPINADVEVEEGAILIEGMRENELGPNSGTAARLRVRVPRNCRKEVVFLPKRTVKAFGRRRSKARRVSTFDVSMCCVVLCES